jgi:hypothetical protein
VHRPDAFNREVNDAEQNSACADCDQEERRPEPGNNRENREDKVDQENCSAHLRMTPSCLHHSLIGVAMVRVIPFLASGDTPAQRDSRIKHERAEEQYPDQ